MLGLMVFRETINTEAQKEVRAVDEATLLGVLGGNLGLWCGVSYMTICELLELAGVMITMAIMGTAHKAAKKSKEKTQDLRDYVNSLNPLQLFRSEKEDSSNALK